LIHRRNEPLADGLADFKEVLTGSMPDYKSFPNLNFTF
jgi:hypothetical protein